MLHYEFLYFVREWEKIGKQLKIQTCRSCNIIKDTYDIGFQLIKSISLAD